MKKTIQIPEGNEFSLFIPFVVLSKNGREDASAALWNDLQVVVHMSNSTANVDCTYSVQAQYVVVSFGNDLKRSSYDVIISGEYERRKVCAPLNNHFAITAWADGNYAEFVVGQPIICPTQTIIGQFNTTQDIIDLTEELRAALAAAEAAKEEYEEKVEELSDVAQQTTLTEGVAAIREDISHISIDTSTIAKQGTNASATLTATQTAATNAYASAEAAKTATVDGNDTAVGVAKEIRGEVGTGSDTAAETGTLFAVVKWVKDKVKSIYNALTDNASGLSVIATKIGTPAQGQPSDLFAAIAAGGGGGGGDAQESTSQEILSKVQQIIDAGIITPEYDGIYFTDGYTPTMPFDLITHIQYVTKIVDNKTISLSSSTISNMTGSMPNSGGVDQTPHLEEVRYNVATSSIARFVFRNITSLKRVYLPEMVTMNFQEAFYACGELREIHIPKLMSASNTSSAFTSSNNIILIEVGVGATSNISFLSAWSPSNALSTTSSSLVDAGETFANNREKFLYNIRTYIAANLNPNITATITFSSAVKAAIQADTATLNSFPASWTIA